MFTWPIPGVDIDFFIVSQLRAQTRTQRAFVREPLYAGDSATVANDFDIIQTIMDNFASAANCFDFHNLKKIVVQCGPSREESNHGQIFLNDRQL